MTSRRIHFHLCVHGAPTSASTVDYACALAEAFGAELRVTSPQLDVKAPSNWLVGGMLAGMAADFEKAAAAAAAELEARLQQRAAALGLKLEIEQTAEFWPAGADETAVKGRVSDLYLLGLPRSDAGQRLTVEAWLFGAGRPCLLHPDDRALPFGFGTSVIAWDMGRSAARAVGDALPLLKRSGHVRVLVVRGEKDIVWSDPAARLVDYLAAHEISAAAEETQLDGRKIGRAILDRAKISTRICW